MEKYNHKIIEPKWQRYWEKNKLFKAIDHDKRPKFYGLIEFPYPSGEGLHVGHVRSNTAMDIICRKRRMQGYNVLYPIGWDAFGLPTENYAIKTGVHPAIVTKKNTDIFRRQLKALGFSFDWEREINTTDPAYYKWTQWIFLQFFKRDLAYKKKMAINWCPSCRIGLANEEVIDGNCERCGTPAEKREKEQWLLAITKYADRLDRDLDEAISVSNPRTLPKKILVGTRNQAKVKMFKDGLKGVKNLEIISLNDLPEIDDSTLKEGDDFRKNARLKSEFYFKKTGIPTISSDHIQWVENWPEDSGFIFHARKLANPKSPRATDDEVGAWIEKIVDKYGESKATFHYAISYTDKHGTNDFISIQRDYLLQKEKSRKTNDGYVFDRYMKDLETKEYRIEQPTSVAFSKFEALMRGDFLNLFAQESRPRLDYLEKIKTQQKNWIGRSEGAEFELRIKNHESRIKVYTTRLDTVFGMTYCVLAPEHGLIQELKPQIKNWRKVEKYLKEAKKQTDLERMADTKEKTGVKLEGVEAINPFNNQAVPVFVADYVLAQYGTGAVMAVPAHDERDYNFAKKYGLKIVHTIEPVTGEPQQKEEFRKSIVALVRNPKTKKLLSINWGPNFGGNLFIGGGLKGDEDSIKCALREIGEETGYKNVKLVTQSEKIHHHYFAYSKNVRRHIEATGFLFELVNEEKIEQKLEKEEQNKFTVEWLSEKEAEQKIADQLHKYLFDKFIKGKIYTADGILNNSSEYNSLTSAEARKKMTAWLIKNGLGRARVNYKLRDWVFSRQHYWGEPIPVVHCERCKKLKPKILLIHGLGSWPDKNWFPWLKREMEKKGYEIFMPALPEPDNPKVKDWLKALKSLKLDDGAPVFVIGHSLGGAAACRFVAAAKIKVKKLILVAPTGPKMETARLKQQDFSQQEINVIKDFSDDLDLAAVKKLTQQTVLYISPDDPYIPMEIQNSYKSLEPKVNILPGKAHFSHDHGGLREFPEILEEFPENLNLGVYPAPEKDLPVELPAVEKYQPTDNGESPLSAITGWVKTKCPNCGGPAKRETDTMPNWAGSSWYYLRYIDPKNKKAFAGMDKLKYWTPVDWYNGGMEHTTLHLLYSRFWHKFLFDLGLAPTSEPYAKRTSQGMVLAEGGVKMSKSKGNIINPDEIVKKFGADALRVYEMFMGPFDQAIAWSTDGLMGGRRFLDKIYDLYSNAKFVDCGGKAKPCEHAAKGVPQMLHKTIKKVGEDIEAMKFNTAISQMMIFINFIGKFDSLPRPAMEKFLILLSPFAPHLAEELWRKLDHKKSIFKESWPEYKAELVKDETINLVIQVNSKVRDILKVSADISEEEAKRIALESEKVKKWIGGKEVKKVIFVKGKLVNIVI